MHYTEHLDTFDILKLRRENPHSDILHNLTDRQIELMQRDGFGDLLEREWAWAARKAKWKKERRFRDMVRRRKVKPDVGNF